jgi:hypothetical protein
LLDSTNEETQRVLLGVKQTRELVFAIVECLFDLKQLRVSFSGKRLPLRVLLDNRGAEVSNNDPEIAFSHRMGEANDLRVFLFVSLDILENLFQGI